MSVVHRAGLAHVRAPSRARPALEQSPVEDHVMATRALVSVVDDDESVRESLPDMLRQFGLATAVFPSAEAFLASGVIRQTDCLILDVKMPGMSGPDLQRELATRGRMIPIVFITASGDKAIRARLLSDGAVECLFKPFGEAALMGAVHAALQRSET